MAYWRDPIADQRMIMDPPLSENYMVQNTITENLVPHLTNNDRTTRYKAWTIVLFCRYSMVQAQMIFSPKFDTTVLDDVGIESFLFTHNRLKPLYEDTKIPIYP